MAPAWVQRNVPAYVVTGSVQFVDATSRLAGGNRRRWDFHDRRRRADLEVYRPIRAGVGWVGLRSILVSPVGRVGDHPAPSVRQRPDGGRTWRA